MWSIIATKADLWWCWSMWPVVYCSCSHFFALQPFFSSYKILVTLTIYYILLNLFLFFSYVMSLSCRCRFILRKKFPNSPDRWNWIIVSRHDVNVLHIRQTRTRAKKRNYTQSKLKMNNFFFFRCWTKDTSELHILAPTAECRQKFFLIRSIYH